MRTVTEKQKARRKQTHKTYVQRFPYLIDEALDKLLKEGFLKK